MQYTISCLLSMQKMLLTRRTQLCTLKESCSKIITWREPNKIEEPTYNIIEVDKKIVKLNNALFEIDQKIKEANAITKIDFKIDLNELTSPISEIK